MEDRSSRTSIIVALIAIVLIVGGIYLLNQSISGQKTSTDEDNNEIVVVTTEEETTPTNFKECQVKGGFIIQGPPQECTISGKTFIEETKVETTTEETIKEEVKTETPATDKDNPTKDPTVLKLATNEFTAKLTAINGNESKYTIVESGFVNSKWVKAGSNMNLVGITQSSFNVTLTVGKTYKFKANITETATGFQINSIDTVTQID